MAGARWLAIAIVLLGLFAVGARYGYPAWSRHEAKKELQAAGLTYSEANFIEQACAGNDVAVLLFFKSGMSVHVQGSDDLTALHCAARKRNIKLIKLLVAGGADVNAKTTRGQTPLIEAAQWNSLDAMKELVAAGAQVNLPDKIGFTALMTTAAHACQTTPCNTEGIDFLLSSGADAKARTSNGQNVLSRLLQGSSTRDTADLSRVIEKLIRAGADPNAKIDGTQPLLTRVAEEGKVQLVQKLISSGADINAVNYRGTALLQALRWDEVVKLLLEAKADPNAADQSGNTPLLEAIRKGYFESAKLLLEAGASTSAVTPGKITPLHAAAGVGDIQLVQLLLNYPNDVNAKDSRGYTPLHFLARASAGDAPARTEIARTLLARGAQRDARNAENLRPYDYALFADALALASELSGKKITVNPLKQQQRGVPPRQPVIPDIPTSKRSFSQ
jgi:cytohesin